MPIKRQTPDAEIDRWIERETERIIKALVYNLAYVGEQVLNEARSTNSYKDQTGNLRSSIGYVIAVDGRIVQTSSFETVRTGGQGSQEGRAFAEQLVSQFPKGICLIVVAGMNYASYVSAKGYNVLDTSELLAERLVPQMLRDLGFRN